jgi:hypothetical protein
MCGEAARPSSPIQALVSEPKRSNRAPQESIFGAATQPLESHGRGKSIGIGIAVAVVLLVPLFLVLHNSQPWQSAEPVAAVTKPQSQAVAELAPSPISAVKNPAKKVRTPASVDQQPETGPALVSSDQNQDPAELWKGVKSGSARAEVTLAKLYLDGNTVPQSCEQTHMLLLAASKKGYKAADNLLTGAYIDRCQPASARQN